MHNASCFWSTPATWASRPNRSSGVSSPTTTIASSPSSTTSSDSHRRTSPATARVVISTIQRLYATLKGEEFAEGADDENPAERKWRPKEPLPVVYTGALPPEYFDVVVIDECHRSIYNLWRQVVEYFDAFLIGLTATPDNRTYGFFQKNVVSEYTHEEAVADKVNVGNEIYLIDTEVTQRGGTIKARQLVERRERQTRARRWEVQDERTDYTVAQLDRSVVNPDQIRTVVRAFRDHWPEMFPGREELPKTLIFAKTDSHADDIIQTVRREFGEGNDFCRKITNAAKSPKSSLTAFRNDYHPRIAVTVDMIATGTDVRPLECLLFMRDVKSRSYFEQMKGRGTRVLTPDDLQKVTPSAPAKTHYVIVDTVGVTKSIKTGSRPLDTKPSVPFKDLAMGLMMGDRSEETVSSLAGRLSRLDNKLGPEDRARIEQAAGRPLSVIVRDLFDAIDPRQGGGRRHRRGPPRTGRRRDAGRPRRANQGGCERLHRAGHRTDGHDPPGQRTDHRPRQPGRTRARRMGRRRGRERRSDRAGLRGVSAGQPRRNRGADDLLHPARAAVAGNPRDAQGRSGEALGRPPTPCSAPRLARVCASRRLQGPTAGQ